MANKKVYKVKVFNLEVRSSNISDFLDLERILSKAASFERNMGHLKNCEDYQKIADNILKEIGEQI